MFYVTFNGKRLTSARFSIDNALDYARDLAMRTAKHLDADDPLYNQRLTAVVSLIFSGPKRICCPTGVQISGDYLDFRPTRPQMPSLSSARFGQSGTVAPF